MHYGHGVFDTDVLLREYKKSMQFLSELSCEFFDLSGLDSQFGTLDKKTALLEMFKHVCNYMRHKLFFVSAFKVSFDVSAPDFKLQS